MSHSIAKTLSYNFKTNECTGTFCDNNVFPKTFDKVTFKISLDALVFEMLGGNIQPVKSANDYKWYMADHELFKKLKNDGVSWQDFKNSFNRDTQKVEGDYSKYIEFYKNYLETYSEKKKLKYVIYSTSRKHYIEKRKGDKYYPTHSIDNAQRFSLGAATAYINSTNNNIMMEVLK